MAVGVGYSVLTLGNHFPSDVLAGYLLGAMMLLMLLSAQSQGYLRAPIVLSDGLRRAVLAVWLLCIAQVGPSPVLLPAVVWLYWSGETGWGTFLLVWSLIVVTRDNVLRLMLIKRGADLPLLLIFAGVIGGLLGFGLVGIFVGPVVLAVAYTLLFAWLDDARTDRRR